jgi:hypothetical protein
VARWLAFLVAALDVLALTIFFVLFTGSGEAIFYGQTSTINSMLSAWLIAAILTPLLVMFAVLSWKNRNWGIASRIHYSLVTVASLAFIWFLSYWNLLGFHY